MATYLELRTRIARDLWRSRTSATDCEFDPDIKDAVRRAIGKHQGADFWFAEQDWQTPIGTVVSTAYYPLPDDLGSVENVKLKDGDCWHTLEILTEQEMDELENYSGHLRPRAFCVINKQFRLAPTPNQPFILNLTGLRVIPAPENDGDENEWTSEAYDLIVWEAEAILNGGLRGNAGKAAICAQMAAESERQLRLRSNRFKPWPNLSPAGWVTSW